MFRSLTALGVCLLLVAPANARDWFVNNLAGEDGNDGLSPISTGARSGPVRTIGKALRRAGHSDRIILANTGEPYRESITLGGRHSGQPKLPFVLVGNGAVLDGTQPVPGDAWEFHAGELFRFEPRRKLTQQLYLDGKPLPQGKPAGVDGRVALEPLEWRYHEGHIYFRPEAGRAPDQYALTYAALPVGITLYQVLHAEIQDLTVQGYQLDGINAHDSAFTVTLAGIIARGNGRSGISIGGSSQVLLEACLAGNNGQAQVRTEGWSHTHIVNCTLLENTAPGLVKEDYSDVQVTDVE